MPLCKMCAEISTVANSVSVVSMSWPMSGGRGRCVEEEEWSVVPVSSAAWSPQGDVYSVAEH